MATLHVRRSFRRIQILRLTFGIKNSAAKRDRFSLRIEYRKHQPAAKTIVGSAFIFLDDQPAFFKLLLRRALLPEMSRKRFPTVGCKSKLKGLTGLFGDAALFKIFAHTARSLALKLILPPGKRPLIKLDDLIAVALACFKPAIVNHLWQRHTRLFGDDPNRFRKINPLDLHHESEDRSAFMTTKAEKHFFGRID